MTHVRSTTRCRLPLGCGAADCKTRALYGDRVLFKDEAHAEDYARKLVEVGAEHGEPELIDLGYDPWEVKQIGGG